MDPQHWFLLPGTTIVLQSTACSVLLTSPPAIYLSSCQCLPPTVPNKQLFLAVVLQLLDVQSGEPPVHIRPFSAVEELTALAQKRICFRHWLKRVHRSLRLHVRLRCPVAFEGVAGIHNSSRNVRLLNKEDVKAVLGIRDI